MSHLLRFELLDSARHPPPPRLGQRLQPEPGLPAREHFERQRVLRLDLPAERDRLNPLDPAQSEPASRHFVRHLLQQFQT